MQFPDMKKVMDEDEGMTVKSGQVIPSPPPPPPLPRLWAKKDHSDSVTKREIARFWTQKRIEEEDHLLSAIKAAARIRARNLSEEDYKLFEKSLEDEDEDSKHSNSAPINGRQISNEVRVGIKDWWTKSKYAYLNQPALESNEAPKRRGSSYLPQFFNYKLTPLYPTSIGAF